MGRSIFPVSGEEPGAHKKGLLVWPEFPPLPCPDQLLDSWDTGTLSQLDTGTCFEPAGHRARPQQCSINIPDCFINGKDYVKRANTLLMSPEGALGPLLPCQMKVSHQLILFALVLTVPLKKTAQA